MKRIDQPEAPAASCRLLIVAGRRLLGQALEALIRQAGCCDDVCVELGVERAVERAAEANPEVVLIDLRLPGGDPFGLAQSIRACCPQSRLLFLDDSLNKGRLQAALRFAEAGYCTQDDSFDELRKALLLVASGNWAFSATAAPHIDQSNRRPRCKASSNIPGWSRLTRRQLEVLALLSEGLTVKQCARRLQIAPSTVDNHKTRLMTRLGVHKVVDLVRLAIQEGLLEQPFSASDEPPTTV